MISVGNREGGRKGLEHGFRSNKKEMDESEVEEGEAYSYQDDDEDEQGRIDPDIALSYIDEKLQNVLGHFQKDFEGVVSAETLGAKYGIYGSFLPTYRRSPAWSHPRSPQRVQNHNTPQSPSPLQVQGDNHTLAQTSVPQSLKHGSASTRSISSYANKHQSQSGLCRQTAKTQSTQFLEECTPKSEAREQRTLKVRLKVGSDNLSVKKNAAIYSGLGLDDSPSSSFDDSPVESEGLSQELPCASPTQILQIMTTIPLFGGHLLSPLPDDIIQLSERPKLLKDIISQSSSFKTSHDTVMGLPYFSVKDNNKIVSGETVTKVVNRKGLPLKMKKEDDDGCPAVNFLLTDSDVDATSCEELVSNALKLPLLSDTSNTMGDSVKKSVNEKVYYGVKTQPLESFSFGGKSNGMAKLAGEVIENRLPDVPNEKTSDSRKLRGSKGEATNSSSNTDSVGTVGLKVKKASKGEFKDPTKQKADKPSSSGSGMVLAYDNAHFSSMEKKKSKRSQSHSLSSKNAGMESATDRATMLKKKQCFDVEAHPCKSELEGSPLQKGLSKSSDKNSKGSGAYKDFFGDVNDQELDIVDSPNSSADRLKTSEIIEKTSLANENTLKDKKNTCEALTGTISGFDLKRSSRDWGTSEKGRPIKNITGADTKDNWVCCDKCQAWRLLPPGSNEESLPDKWDCSMLTWLPGMNRCGISDDETTTAVRACYQLLAESSNSLHVPPDDRCCSSVPNDEKMVDKLRKTSKSSFQDSLPRPSSIIRKKQLLAKDKTSTDAKEFPAMDRPDFHQQCKSSEVFMEANQQKKIDKHRADSDSGRGHAKMSKIKSKRERDEEFSRDSKKSKKRITQSGNNDRATEKYGGDDMMITSGSSLATNTPSKEKMSSSELFSSRKSKDDMDGDWPDSSYKLKFRVEGLPDIASLQVNKFERGIVTPRKRKVENLQQPASSTPSSGKLIPGHDESIRKKHRTSKSEGKESSSSKRNGKIKKKSETSSRQSLRNTESLQKVPLCALPAVAATSSSSKVSCSLRVRPKFQELKGSPVESVSSSPFRTLNSVKLTSGSKIKVEKDNVANAVKFSTGSPRRCSDDDYQCGGSGQSAFIRKDDNLVRGEHILDRCLNEPNGDDGHQNINVSHSEKNMKDFSPVCKDKSMKPNADKGKVNISESYDNSRDCGPVSEEKERDGKIKIPDTFASNVYKPEENSICNLQESSIPKSKAQVDCDLKKSSKKLDMDKSLQVGSIYAREKFKPLLASDVEKHEKSNCTDARLSDHHKEPKSNSKAASQNGTHHVPSNRQTSNGHRSKNQDVPSPLRRDVTSQAAGNAIKEAKNLKHLADRLKRDSGSTESTGYYFEAALKFLHGAALLESGKTENTKHMDMLQSTKIYSDTAKLCGFCAHEYEKCKDMATAALAYKCMEVAYLRVIYSSHNSSTRDRHELQTVLQMVPPGESPSSSASDIDNLNNSVTVDKDPQVRNGGSPQIVTDLVISANNRPRFERLLNFAQDVNFAMEASRKSRTAFAAANVKMDLRDSKDVMLSIKSALDFNFHDVQGLLRLVRIAKEATSR